MDTRRLVVMETLLYASVQRRLLTLEEFFRYQRRLPECCQLSMDELAVELEAEPSITFSKGVYGFADEFDELWKIRQEKGRESIRRWRKVKKYGQIMVSLPFIRGIFVAGSLGFSTGNAKSSSDIDVFIVVEDGRIWLTRVWITLVTQFLGIRRRGDYDENLFCLNHYSTKSSLQRRDYDVYAAQLYADYIAIGEDSWKLLRKFWVVNSWVYSWFPLARGRYYLGVSDIKTLKGKRFLEKLVNFLGANFWNSILRSVQRRKIESNPLTQAANSRIRATDVELEFHPFPHSVRVAEQLAEKRAGRLL